MRQAYIPTFACAIFAFFALTQIAGCRHDETGRTLDALPRAALSERFCDADIVPHQVLLTPSNCPPDFDAQALSQNLTAFARKNSDPNEKISIVQLDDRCRLLAESSSKTEAQLRSFFQVFVSLNNRDKQTEESLKDNKLDSFSVDLIEPNFKITIDDRGLPPRTSATTGAPWWFRSDFPGADAVNAWKEYGQGSSEVVVAILDTGVSSGHPALQNNMWRASTEFNVTLGKQKVSCEAGTIGFNATTTDPKSICTPEDDSGHGTHVAGIIGALNQQSDSPIGVNSNVKLMPIKIFDGKSTTVDRVITAIEFALKIKQFFGNRADIRVLNNSYTLFLQCDSEIRTLRAKIDETNEKGMLFVAAAGERKPTFPDDPINDDDVTHTYPAGFSLQNVLSITAIDESGSLLISFGEQSNHGRQTVHMGAPGDAIFSTDLLSHNGGFSERNGTSMATPFVSGAAALLVSVPGCSGLSAAAVKETMLRGTTDTPSLVGKTVTDGRLDIYKAIQLCATPRKAASPH